MNKFIVLSLALLAIFGAVQAQNLGGFLDQAASLANSNTVNSVSNSASSTANSAADLAAANINSNPNLTNTVADQVSNLNVSANSAQDSLNSAATTAGSAVGAAIAQPADSYNALVGDLSSLLNQAQNQSVSGVENKAISLEGTVQNAADSLASSLGYNLTATASSLLNQLDNATGIVGDIKNISANVNASDLLNQAGVIAGDSNLGLANLSNLYANLTNNVNQIVDLNTPFNGTYLQCVEQSCVGEISACYADNSCSVYYAQQQGCFSAYKCDTVNSTTENCYDVCLNTNQTANDAPFAALNACALKSCTYSAVLNSSGVYDVLGNFFSNAYVNASTAAISIANVANASELYNNATRSANFSMFAMNATDLYRNATNATQSYLNLTSMGVMNAANMSVVDGETIVQNANATLANATLSGINGLTNMTNMTSMTNMINTTNMSVTDGEGMASNMMNLTNNGI